jgi:hypothetical protein
MSEFKYVRNTGKFLDVTFVCSVTVMNRFLHSVSKQSIVATNVYTELTKNGVTISSSVHKRS